MEVTDLHAITPSEFLEFGDAIVNNLSYQQARHYNRSPTGVYVANPGYLLSKAAIPRGAVITEFGGDPIENIDDFEAALATLADGEREQLRYVTMDNPQNSIVRSLEMDRVWFPTRRCARDDRTGVWPCRDLADGPAPAPPKVGHTELKKYDDPRVKAIAPSLVVVTFDLPYTLSGVAERHYYGTGLIVDKERGLVVVDRNTVPIAIGDVTVTFAGSLEVRAKIEQLHPLHNLAIISYDPALINDTAVKAASFNPEALAPGEDVWKADHDEVVKTSSGTSYSTASVAGLAALWLAHWGRDFLMNQYPDTPLNEVFRWVLKRSSIRPAGWNIRKWGSGIVDAKALLKSELPALSKVKDSMRRKTKSQRAAETARFPELSLAFESLEPADVEARVARLTGLGDTADVAGLEDELMFHVLTTPALRDAMTGAADEFVQQADAVASSWAGSAQLSDRLKQALGAG